MQRAQTPPDIDAARCPLCGRGNLCAIEAGAPVQDCWCMAAPVSREALAAVPEGLRGRACLCPQCAAGAPAPAGTPKAPI